MLDSSFPVYVEKVDCSLPRKCGTCSLWQLGVTTPSGDRCRCACPVPDSVKRSTKYFGYTNAEDGCYCHFWHPIKREL